MRRASFFLLPPPQNCDAVWAKDYAFHLGVSLIAFGPPFLPFSFTSIIVPTLSLFPLRFYLLRVEWSLAFFFASGGDGEVLSSRLDGDPFSLPLPLLQTMPLRPQKQKSFLPLILQSGVLFPCNPNEYTFTILVPRTTGQPRSPLISFPC